MVAGSRNEVPAIMCKGESPQIIEGQNFGNRAYMAASLPAENSGRYLAFRVLLS